LYVNAEVVLSSTTIPLAVQSQALQTLEGRNVVFVRDSNGFEAREVTIGRNDGEITEILSGIAPGDSYATHNSFTLKAELGKGEAAHED
jgi:cobalt-zinc-cadmium efflux system membrane fusion protein